MRLDDMTNPAASEVLSKRLWRRYAASAFEMLELIREDPANAECIIENAEYLRCEISQTARREMITKLDDFLRRRSKISLVVREEDLRSAKGLEEACRVFFGADADAKLAEYFRDQSAASRRNAPSSGNATVCLATSSS